VTRTMGDRSFQPTTSSIILDVDTGIDDTIALTMAARAPALDLVGVTTVAGNVGVERTTENTLRVLAWLGAESVPVHRGMSGPLARPHRDAAQFHGVDGLGGVQLPESPIPAQPITAPEFIVQQARARPGELTLLCVAPLTNLAVALSLEPELPRLINRVVVMGGAFTVPGNVTQAAEFNVYADPEAAAMIARSQLPITNVGLDVTHQVGLSRDAWRALADRPTAEVRLVYAVSARCFEQQELDHLYLHDPLAVAVTLDPELIETERSAVVVDTGSGVSAGQTRLIGDASMVWHDVALSVKIEAFHHMFASLLDVPLVR
jgi:purine nucleosidase